MADKKWFSPGSLVDAGKANWHNSGTMKKFARVGGTALGTIVLAKGAHNLARVVGVASPDLDEQGNEIPVGLGTLVMSAGQIGFGATVDYLSLIKGGHARIGR